MQYHYNIGAQYEIIGRIQSGTTVKYYIIKDRTDDTEHKMEKAVVEQLALNKQIYNCQAQIYGDLVNLKGINCKLSQLPKYDDDCNVLDESDKPKKKKVVKDIRIVGKVHCGKNITDYVVVCISDPEKLFKVPKDTVLQLAKDGRIVNAKVQYNNGVLILRGTEKDSLSNLTQYK